MKPIIDNPNGSPTVILAHGAGAPMDSPFMNSIATGLSQGGLRVVRFEFPYMAERRKDGKKRGPNGQAVLLDTWREVVGEYAEASDCVIGGKSMGGRMASMLADELGVRGLICLGYPFHPPGKPEKARTEHLAGLATPALIIQGTRDPFGTADDVAGYDLSPAITVAWLEAGNHSFVPTKASGRTEEQNLAEAVALALDFIEDSE